MTTSAGPSLPSTAREQAVHWFARVRLGPLSTEDQAELEAWLAASSQNQAHFQELQKAWNKLDELPVDRLRRLTQEPAAPQKKPVQRWRPAFAAMAVGAVVAGVWLWPAGPEQSWAVSTTVAQRQELRLPDDSVLTVNARTKINVVYTSSERRVYLESGEILADVRTDADRPFIVETEQAKVQVLGTRFNVRKQSDQVEVAVDRGRVRLSAGPWWNSRSERLGVGQAARVTARQGLEPVREADVAALTAWQSGRLEFDDEPLAQVLEQLSAYLDEPIRLGDAQLGQLRISGTLSMSKPQEALLLLADIAPVQILNVESKGWVINRR
nr:FecR domain-containing protein [Alcaligenes faecalis]